MPQDRFIHPRLGHSEKVTLLTDLEFRVWMQYLLSADDFGVMRASAVSLQADSDALAARKPRIVQAAFDRLVTVGLVIAFDHQGRRYVCQPDWQRFQKVGYARATNNPKPPSDVLSICSAETQLLFESDHPGGFQKRVPKHSGKISEIVPERSENISPKPLAVSHSREPLAVERGTRARSASVLDGSLPREHLSHVFCDDSFSICVAPQVHGKLLGLLARKFSGDREQSHKALLEWYPRAVGALSAETIMGDGFKFWQKLFDAEFVVHELTKTEKDHDADTQRQADAVLALLNKSRTA